MIFIKRKNTIYTMYPWIDDYTVLNFFNTKRGENLLFYIEHEKIQFYDNLEPCIPTNEEVQKMKEFYNNFCTEHKLEKNADIVRCLEDMEYNKECAKKIVQNTFKDFENNLNNNMFFISSLGFKVNGDRRTITNISTMIDKMLYTMNKEPLTAQEGDQIVNPQDAKIIEFMDYNDNKHMLSFNDLVQIKDEHATNGQALYNQMWQKLEQIENATDFDSLQVDLTYKMQDFSEQSQAPTKGRKKRSLEIVQNLEFSKKWSNIKNDF